MGGGSNNNANNNNNQQQGYGGGGNNYFGMPPMGASAPPQQQHQQRLRQLQLQQQQLEMQLKQQNTQSRSNQQPQTQQQQNQQQQFMMQQKQRHLQLQQLQRQKSSSTGDPKQQQRSSSSSAPTSLTRPPDLKKPPNLPVKTSNLSGVKQQNQLLQARPGTDAPGGGKSATTGNGGTSNSNTTAKPHAVRRDASSHTSAPPLIPTDQMKEMLTRCNWSDRTIYVSRLLLGGAATNGFLRSTATAQRIKKQRARQTKKQNVEQDEEDLKKDAMNPRTAKKIRSELFLGLKFSKALYATLQTILKELEPSHTLAPLQDPHPVAAGLQSADPYASTTTILPTKPPSTDKSTTVSAPSATATNAFLNKSITAPAPTSTPAAKPAVPPGEQTTSATTASPGDPTGSSFRKLRKRKFEPLPPSPLDAMAPTGKKYSKKDQALRLLEWNRFRALQKGDYVAAKVSSRDLWILARILDPYPAPAMAPTDFLSLTDSKRDGLFRDKVTIRDVEDSNSASANHVVVRSHILPLPRTFAEAADWASRCRKGSRVYAMYPMTTSLYSGTVIDHTTYCRGDDDIIVVEFDGDEANSDTGKMPIYHIPARFVTLIPKEFPAAQSSSKNKRKSSATVVLPKAAAASASSSSPHQPVTKKPRTSTIKQQQQSPQQPRKRSNSNDSALNTMMDEISYSGIGMGDDLDVDDFDLGFDMGK